MWLDCQFAPPQSSEADFTGSPGSVGKATRNQWFKVFLEVIVVLVAQRASASIDNIRQSQISGDEVVEAQDGIHLQGTCAGVAPVVAPAREARGRLARAVAALLPRGVLRVDEEVVHEEGGVLGSGPDVSHDGADAVVAGSVGSVRE